VQGQKLTYDRSYCGTHLRFFKNLVGRVMQSFIVEYKISFADGCYSVFYYSRAPIAVQKENYSGSSWFVMFGAYSITHTIRHAYWIMKPGVWWAM
jgi:hypothetical protein